MMLSARSRSLFDWRLNLPEIDIERFEKKFLDPIAGKFGEVLCPINNECPVEECFNRQIRDLSEGTVACCTKRYGVQNIKVAPYDLYAFSLSYARFHGELCKKLGIELSNTDMDNHYFWELGVMKIGTARRAPLYISYYQSPAQLDEKIQLLLSSAVSSFALIVFDSSLIRPATNAALTAKKCISLTLPELVKINHDCSLSLVTDLSVVLGIFKSNDTPTRIKTYTCAAGTKWSDIYIGVLDANTITINSRGEAPIAFSYNQIGMGSAKNNAPTHAFRTLLKFLETTNGTVELPAKSSREYDFLVQRKKELNTCLKKVFPSIIDRDPIVYDRKTFSYCIRFNNQRTAVITK